MRADFEFSNVLGGAYTDGNICFTKDGRSLLSPIGNRVGVYDLAQNRNVALPFEINRNIRFMDLSDDEDLLILADNQSQVTFVHFPSSTRLESCQLADSKTIEPPTALKLSPSGNTFAAAVCDYVEVWTTPRPRVFKFRSVARLSRLSLCASPASCLRWFKDSRFLVIGYEDNSIRITASALRYGRNIDAMASRTPVFTLKAMKAYILGIFFLNKDNTDLMYFCATGQVARSSMLSGERTNSALNMSCNLRNLVNPGRIPYNLRRWHTEDTIALPGSKGAKGLRCVDYNYSATLLAAGYHNGKFVLYDVSTEKELQFTALQELTISAQALTSIALNPSGDWMAVGSRKLGQILVWDWRSETYVLRQQAHQAADISCVAYSFDGSIVATGGEDGKVKGWKGAHSYCFVTFTEHTGAIVDVKFNSTNSLFSASLDGTIRAYDMNRYRHYRVFTTPHPVQFSCIALDPSGEVLAAGCSDVFDVYVWSAKTGRILEILPGHEGPVSRVHFSPLDNILVSGSWDKTLKIWPMFIGDVRTKENAESVQLLSEVLFMCFNNSGSEIAAITLQGTIEFFDSTDLKNVKQSRGGIDMSRDIQGGYIVDEITKPNSRKAGRYVDTAAYTANDLGFLVAGHSKWICLYDTVHRLLLRRWQMSINMSIDGIRDAYDWRAKTEAGDRNLLDASDLFDIEGKPMELPGVEKGKIGAVGKRLSRPVARTKFLAFSPNGREWAAATTAGLLIYSLDGAATSFRPLKLEYALTPQKVYETLRDGNYGLALHQALQLNDATVLRAVLYGIPSVEIEFIAGQVPSGHVAQMLELVTAELQSGKHFEFCLQWALQLQLKHALLIEREGLLPQLKDLARVISSKASELKAMADSNAYGLKYLQCVSALEKKEAAQQEWSESEDDAPVVPSTQRQPTGQKGTKKRKSVSAVSDAKDTKKSHTAATAKQKKVPKKRKVDSISG